MSIKKLPWNNDDDYDMVLMMIRGAVPKKKPVIFWEFVALKRPKKHPKLKKKTPPSDVVKKNGILWKFFQKGGAGGPTFGKNFQKIPFFLDSVPYAMVLMSIRMIT